MHGKTKGTDGTAPLKDNVAPCYSGPEHLSATQDYARLIITGLQWNIAVHACYMDTEIGIAQHAWINSIAGLSIGLSVKIPMPHKIWHGAGLSQLHAKVAGHHSTSPRMKEGSNSMRARRLSSQYDKLMGSLKVNECVVMIVSLQASKEIASALLSGSRQLHDTSSIK